MARRLSLIAMLALALAPAAVWAMTIGASEIGLDEIGNAITGYNGSNHHIVIMSVRLPRVVCALIVGAALAVAGSIMQAVTGNPLASPGLLGVNAGAAFAVVLAIVFLDAPANATFMWFAFSGAAAAAVAVYLVASSGRGGLTPVKLVLSGAIFAAFLTALTTAVLIFDADTFAAVRLWTAGSLSGAESANVTAVAPYALVGLFCAFAISSQITTLSLGPDVSRSVGQNVVKWQLVSGLCVVTLAGSAVALAGPIGFVGLVVPHIARSLVGRDYRWVIPFCALAGALLVLVADALLRLAIPGQEVPVGVTMALIGAPFFIYLARYRLGGGRQ